MELKKIETQDVNIWLSIARENRLADIAVLNTEALKYKEKILEAKRFIYDALVADGKNRLAAKEENPLVDLFWTTSDLCSKLEDVSHEDVLINAVRTTVWQTYCVKINGVWFWKIQDYYAYKWFSKDMEQYLMLDWLMCSVLFFPDLSYFKFDDIKTDYIRGWLQSRNELIDLLERLNFSTPLN